MAYAQIGVIQNNAAGIPIDLSSPWAWSLSKKIKWNVDASTRLTNLSYNAATWGTFIPITWGVARIQGAMVWASSFREGLVTTTWKRLSAAGRPKFQTNLAYVYHVDVGYSFGYNGSPGKRRYLSRLYANNAIIYDLAGGYRYPGITFTFKDGDPDQLPATIYIKDKGEDAIAFRNQMTVFLENLPIQDFGSAIPAVWAEIVEEDDTAGRTVDFTRTETTDASGAHGPPMIDWTRRLLFQPLQHYDKDSNYIAGIAAYDLDGRSQLYEYKIEPELTDRTFDNYVYIPWMQMIVINFTLDGTARIVELDTGRVISSSELGDGPPGNYLVSVEICPDYLDGGGCWFAGFTLIGNIIAARRLNKDGAVDGVLSFKVHPSNGATFNAIYGDEALPRFYIASRIDGHNFISLLDVENQAIDYEWIAVPETHDAYLNSWMVSWNGMVIAAYENAGAELGVIFAFDIETKEVVWRIDVDSANKVHVSRNWFKAANTEGGTLAWPYYSSSATATMVLDLMSGTLTTILATGIGDAVWDSNTNSFYTTRSFAFGGLPFQAYAILPPAGSLRLDRWIEDVMKLAGYTPDQFTISGVDDLIEGAFINQSYDVIQMLKDVCTLYQISMTETDGKIRFSKKYDGDSEVVPELSIDYSQLAWIDQSNDSKTAIQMKMASGVTTPTEITVNFINPEINYQDDNYTYARPGAVSASKQSVSLDVPLMLDKTEVARLTKNMLYDMWGGQLTGEIRLSRSHYYVDEGTIINFSHGSFQDIIRLTECTHNGDWSVSASFEVVRSQRYAKGAVDAANPNNPPPRGRPESEFYLFDVPFLKNTDAIEGKVVVYMTINGMGQPNWPGGYIAYTPDLDQSWSALGNITNEISTGRIVNTVPSDEGSSNGLRGLFGGKNPFEGQNATVDELQENPDRNLAFYGVNGRWELIQWQTATLDRGFVVFDGIARGVRGTGTAGHQPGDIFIPVGKNIRRVGFPLSVIGTTQYFKAVGYGLAIERAPVYDFLIEAATLKPWSPVIRRIADTEVDADVIIKWYRRDRLGFSTLGTDEELPLSDPPEEYELELIDDLGVVYRTAVGITSPEWNYTRTMQLADHYAVDYLTDVDGNRLTDVSGNYLTVRSDNSPPLRVRVYQISATVGRGFPAEAIVYPEDY